MTVSYLHGLETVELNDGLRPVQTAKSSVIGLTGTAPDADPDLFPLNTPVAIFADSLKANKLGSSGTLLDAIDAIFNQGSSTVVVNRTAEGETEAEAWANAIGSPTGKTGVWSLLKARPILKVVPKLLIASGLTGGRPTNGVSNVVISDDGQGYVPASTIVTFAAAPAGGRTAQGVAKVVAGSVTAIIVTDPGYGYSAPPAVTIGGVGTGAAATATLGHVANPVAKALEALAPRLRGMAFVDGPGTNYDDAVSYRSDFDSQRLVVIDPGVLSFDTETAAYVTKPSSAYAAGLQARIDDERGFWNSFSNEEILGIGGPSRPVDYMPNDRDAEANMLNANEVVTIVHDEGYRFWGLRSTTQDSLWAFYAVRRTADMIYESLERAHRPFMDKPISYALLDSIQGSVNAYLRLLRSRGALINGQCWIDPAANTPAGFASGELVTDFDLEPPAPLEKLQFRSRRNPQYYQEFIEEFARTTGTSR